MKLFRPIEGFFPPPGRRKQTYESPFLPMNKKIKKVIATFYLKILTYFSQLRIYISQFWPFPQNSEI